MDLFSLYVLFSHCLVCDESPENCFFQMSRYPRAYAHTTNEKTKGWRTCRGLNWENKT